MKHFWFVWKTNSEQNVVAVPTSLRQPEFEGAVVGAGRNQFAIWGNVDAHHL